MTFIKEHKIEEKDLNTVLISFVTRDFFTMASLKVYLYLVLQLSNNDRFKITTAKLAQAVRISERHMPRILRELEGLCLIRNEPQERNKLAMVLSTSVDDVEKGNFVIPSRCNKG